MSWWIDFRIHTYIDQRQKEARVVVTDPHIGISLHVRPTTTRKKEGHYLGGEAVKDVALAHI